MTQPFANDNLPYPPAGGAAPQERAQSGGGVEARVQSGLKAIQQQFQALLEADQDINPDQREHMARFFEQALEDAAASSAPAADDVFDPATWTGTVDQLRRSGDIAADEADHLIRSLNEALAPLERRESRLALEFSRRMASEGEARAIAWLRQQSSEGEAEAARRPAPPPVAQVATLHSDVVNSRSRRLRGPPK